MTEKTGVHGFDPMQWALALAIGLGAIAVTVAAVRGDFRGAGSAIADFASGNSGGGNGGFNTAHTGGMPSWMDGKPFVPHGGKPPAAPSGYHWNPFSQPQPTADTGCNKGELRFNPNTGRMQACGPL